MNKLKNEVGNNIKKRLDSLKSGIAAKQLNTNPQSPLKEKEKNRLSAVAYADNLDEKIEKLTPLIKSLRRHINYIRDQDKYVAAYLLIGKAYTNLKAISVLVRLGYSAQIVELVRSSIEALDLSNTFLEDKQENELTKWFNGEIIANHKARRALDTAINEMNKEMGGESLPVKEMLSNIYFIYSLYTHNGYSVLTDFIDVYNEDFDFNQYAQYHYNLENLHLIDDLYVKILLRMKNYYSYKNDEDKFKQVNQLLISEQ